MTKYLIALLLISNLAFAHGEGTLGPHQGYIKMPAMYHTELVPVSDREFNVYLMNVNNEEPVVLNSKVDMVLNEDNKKIDSVICRAKTDHFNCTFRKSTNIQKGRIILNSVRSNEAGHPAIYDLPLALK